MSDVILGFAPEVFARRRAKAIEGLDKGILLLPSAPLLFRSRDTEHRYRPDSDLFYLTGWTQPDALAVLQDCDEDHRFTLFVPRKDAKTELWSGSRPGLDEARERFGADVVFPMDELDWRLTELLRKPERIFFRLGAHAQMEGVVVDALRTARTRGPRLGDGPRSVHDPGQILDPLRLRKDAEEVERIQRATALTVGAFRQAIAGVHPGMGEWEVESSLESAYRRGGGSGPAFPTIVGSGNNACTLHYTENGSPIRDGDLVLVDGGAELDLYCGDVTRTFPAGGHFSTRQLDVYELVLSALRAATDVVRPGATVAEVHDAATETLTGGLVDMGVLVGAQEELIREKSYDGFYPHQTSHWLGLDVHDVGDYAQGGKGIPLEPGMVLTVEPGLYFPPTTKGPGGRYAGVAVRIEDDLLVTEEGCQNLTAALPSSPGELEALVGSEPS